MADIRLGVAMNGVSGRMGTNQHLIRSIKKIREDGGVALSDGRRIVPDPLFVGRSEDKLAALAATHGFDKWTTDLDAAIQDPDYPLFFDTASTVHRAEILR
ncbi:MAG: gfo/Idh/MocA family oxidoreductase, partial [Defluviicoccus sp.]|nr:gfo/Idh/MocA family oxidoreductase [Defluviicoccus sp.]